MFEQFQEPIDEILAGEGIQREAKLLTPPDPDLGDFCIVVNQIAGKADPEMIAEKLQPILKDLRGIEQVSVFNAGSKKKKIIYLNFTISDEEKQSIQTGRISSVLERISGPNYGKLDKNNGKVAIVEHTSANPISPIHVGNLRNSVQGDTFARILEHSGYEVYVHYYVNDVGLQIGFVVVGYELVKKLGKKPPIKIDLWTGRIYAIMNCLYTIQKLKKSAITRGAKLGTDYQISDSEENTMVVAIDSELENLEDKIAEIDELDKPSGVEKTQLKELKLEKTKLISEKSEISKYRKTFTDLSSRFPEMFSILLEEVSNIDLMETVSQYLKAYETNSDQRVTELFREVVSWVLSAFEWTLSRYNIEFDQFDYESDVAWSGKPNEIIDELSNSENAAVDGQAVRYSYPSKSLKAFMKATGLTKKDMAIRGQVPELQLRRSDGTALYAAKDIAYSLVKFDQRKPEKVYNVISMEQSLPQFQMLLPLHELGYTEQAANLKHYAYDNVDLKGRTMSGRLAKYITADDYYDESYIRARMAKRAADTDRGVDLPDSEEGWREENEILQAVALASTRFPLIETSPNKRITLDLDRELDFKRNAGPFVQYAHARTNSLIDRVKSEKGWDTEAVDYSKIADFEVVEICNHLDDLDRQILLAVEEEDPSKIANWVHHLAQQFMKFYEKFPVLKADDAATGIARLAVVKAIRTGLATGLSILGIPAAKRL